MDLEYRWKAHGVTGPWHAVQGSDDVDNYDDVARQALSIDTVDRVAFRLPDGALLQYRRTKAKK